MFSKIKKKTSRAKQYNLNDISKEQYIVHLLNDIARGKGGKLMSTFINKVTVVAAGLAPLRSA